ncbi:hypothetical protein HPB48_000557 [Haemaphysalis longicornis]|uniref:Myb/SANT-like DNA-binding domain-containing protein n=1 Tax=Haemaphysalis longicornis TaxID=44386 RepID=A0A9J6GKN6_HAELO|nr:hypothetical protein HPB48_000557 [Haemaphysalis longicornis]
MGERDRRNRSQWTESETIGLVKVWRDHLSDLRRTKRNAKVYAAIAEALSAEGIIKAQSHNKQNGKLWQQLQGRPVSFFSSQILPLASLIFSFEDGSVWFAVNQLPGSLGKDVI